MTQQQREFFEVASKFGVPFLVLALLLWMLREASQAIHATVLVPVVESHVQFLDGMAGTLKVIGESQERQAEAMEELADGQRQLQNAIGTIRTDITKPTGER